MARPRFANLDGSGPRPLSDLLKWALWDRALGRRTRSRWEGTTPSVTPDPRALQTPPGPDEGARLTWLGHASWLVQLDGLSLLIDPVLSPSKTNHPRT
jgi:hypothetical protein